CSSYVRLAPLLSLSSFLITLRPPPRPTLFPYTTLFRSGGAPPPPPSGRREPPRLCGRAIPWAELNGLLPGRGPPDFGPGFGPGLGAGAGFGVAFSAERGVGLAAFS